MTTTIAGGCRDRAKRDAMNDSDFWHYVLLGIEPGAPQPDGDYEFDADELQAIAELTSCDECGELGPCAYDDHGRALVHLIQEDDA